MITAVNSARSPQNVPIAILWVVFSEILEKNGWIYLW